MFRNDAPLFLPPGSVRAILALGVIALFAFGKVDGSIALLVLGAYFTTRANKTTP